MKRWWPGILVAVGFGASMWCYDLWRTNVYAQREYKSGIVWPEPPVVTWQYGCMPPSDAKVLFDGKDLSQWKNGENWVIEDGYAVAKNRALPPKNVW